MATEDRAVQLRARARTLRMLARTIEQSPVTELDRYADDLTWQGRRPDLCRTLLHTHRRQLDVALEGLRWQAYSFEQRADQIEESNVLWGRVG